MNFSSFSNISSVIYHRFKMKLLQWPRSHCTLSAVLVDLRGVQRSFIYFQCLVLDFYLVTMTFFNRSSESIFTFLKIKNTIRNDDNFVYAVPVSPVPYDHILHNKQRIFNNELRYACHFSQHDFVANRNFTKKK